MADANFIEYGKTNGGKVIGFRACSDAALYEICFNSGGEVHESMKGRYTSPRDAKIAIDFYLENHQKKPVAKKTTAKKVA